MLELSHCFVVIAFSEVDEALAGNPVSTLSRAQDGSRNPKSCVRLWKTPTPEGPNHRTGTLPDQEERVFVVSP